MHYENKTDVLNGIAERHIAEYQPIIKTYENWKGDLGEYLQVGDYTDEEMAMYFLNVMPPAYQASDLIQIGEPYSHVNGKATYATIAKDAYGWQFCGHCHRGEIYEPEKPVKKTYQQYMHQLGKALREATLKGDAALCEEILEEKNRLELYPEDYENF